MVEQFIRKVDPFRDVSYPDWYERQMMNVAELVLHPVNLISINI